MGIVVAFPMTEEAEGRLAVRARAAEYARCPTLENARELVRAVRDFSPQLRGMGVSSRSRDALAGMDPDSSQDAMILTCANAALRALRTAENRRPKK
jgi:hypothetical protein